MIIPQRLGLAQMTMENKIWTGWQGIQFGFHTLPPYLTEPFTHTHTHTFFLTEPQRHSHTHTHTHTHTHFFFFNWATEKSSSSGLFYCEPAFWGQISSHVQFCPHIFFLPGAGTDMQKRKGQGELRKPFQNTAENPAVWKHAQRGRIEYRTSRTTRLFVKAITGPPAWKWGQEKRCETLEIGIIEQMELGTVCAFTAAPGLGFKRPGRGPRTACLSCVWVHSCAPLHAGSQTANRNCCLFSSPGEADTPNLHMLLEDFSWCWPSSEAIS